MSRLIFTVAIGEEGRKLQEFSKKPLDAYAARCFADVKVIDEQFDYPTPKHAFLVGLAIAIMKKYDEILYVDADVIISPDAPNIFEAFDIDKNFLALRPDPGIQNPRNQADFLEWQKDNKITFWDEDCTYYNLGVMLLGLGTAQLICDVFREPFKVGFMDQHELNCLINRNFIFPTPLASRWNYFVAELPWADPPGQDVAYFKHFIAPEGKKLLYKSNKFSNAHLANRTTLIAYIASQANETDIFVEIGTYVGNFAHCIAHYFPGTVYLVDMWEEDPDYSERNMANNVEYAQMYFNLIKHFAGNEKVHPVKLTSIEAAKLFEDESIFCAYIDANHEKAFVEKDIQHWWPKIKPGGFLTGHDYMNETEPNYPNWCGAKDAVDEFVTKTKLSLQTTNETGFRTKQGPKSWLIQKPCTPKTC